MLCELFAVADGPSMNPLMVLVFIMVIVGIGVKMYLLVFKPEVWDMHQRREEEAKQHRAERLEKAAKGAAFLYKWLKK